MASRIYLLIIAISVASFSSCDKSVDSSVEGCTDNGACNYNSLADRDDGSCLTLDQCGVCGGTGVPNGACDCSGNILDCSGECGGPASTDECGECDSDPTNNCTQDCLGAWGGDAAIDPCGVCNGNSVNAEECSEECIHDCFGLCPDDSGYGSEFDQCGVCGGTGVPNGACDCSGNILDCSGECGGPASTDECGECDSDPTNNCTQDCLGVWGGSATVDLCGICGGDNGSCTGCMNSDASNYNENATIDDGSCIVPGCTDPSASNYNQYATSNDGSCLYGDCIGYDVCLGIENVDLDTSTLDIVVHSNINISGFQFDLGDWDYEGNWEENDLNISSVYNGVATDEGFSISSSSNKVIGFSFSGSFIPVGSHTLVSISFSDFSDSICISAPIFSDSNANALTVSSGECYPQSITGESQLILIKDTVSSLETDDIVYVYDSLGLMNSGSCSSEIGRVLVAVGIWTSGQQLELSAVGSIDLCSLGGMQFPGFVSGNSIEIEVQRQDITFSVSELELEAGTGKFGDIMTVISEIYIN